MFRSQGLNLLRRAATASAAVPTTARPRAAAALLQSAAPRAAPMAAAASLLRPGGRAMGTHASTGTGDVPLGGGLNGIHTQGGGGGAGGGATLAELLDRELQEETELLNSEERPQELEEVSEKIHKRFHIKETPGSSLVKMHTKHDLEKVLVQFDVQDTTEDELNPEELEGEDAQDYTVGVRGVASVTKGHHKMLFSLVFTNTVWVEKVAFDAQGREWDDDSLYWSDFSEYPEDVQDAFTGYLAERHIDDELAVFVSYYAYEKEKEHYVGFLEDARGFVAK